jgi:hypothetical protein
MEPAFRSFGRQQFNRALSAARLPQAETAVHLAAELAGERLDFGEASRDFEKQQAKRVSPFAVVLFPRVLASLNKAGLDWWACMWASRDTVKAPRLACVKVPPSVTYTPPRNSPQLRDQFPHRAAQTFRGFNSRCLMLNVPMASACPTIAAARTC